MPLTPSWTATHALVPGSGGRIETGLFLPLTEALMEKVPFFSVMLSDFTALCSPLLSLYLNPSGAVALRADVPEVADCRRLLNSNRRAVPFPGSEAFEQVA